MLSTEQQAFTAPEGISLRYGLLYGGDPGMGALLAKRAVPVADGGLLGWVHHRDAVAATVAALEHGRPGQAYNIVDDQPAMWEEVFTAMVGIESEKLGIERAGARLLCTVVDSRMQVARC